MSDRTYTNQVSSVNAANGATALLATGAVVNETTSNFGADSVTSTARSTVHDVAALNGLVTATEVRATSETTRDASGVNKNTGVDDYTADDTGSGVHFVNLTIGGTPISLPDPEPNTSVPLPNGVGHVVLNEQAVVAQPKITVGSKKYAPGLIVNAMHVYVDDLGGYHGDFVVGHAETVLRPVTALLSGYAFAAQARVAPPVVLGRQSVIYLPCPGTKGVTKEIVGAGVALPGLASSGTTRGTVEGAAPADRSASNPAYSESTETIEDLHLLGSAGAPEITADLIRSTARVEGASASPGPEPSRWSTSSSRAVEPMSGAVPANTEIPLPGIGYLRINQQECTGKTATGTPCSFSTYGQLTVRATPPQGHRPRQPPRPRRRRRDLDRCRPR